MIRLAPLLSLLPLAACDLAPGGDECAGGGKCDVATDVRSQLDGLNEPIADWLRASPMTRDGVLETDYMHAMENIGEFMGCDLDTVKTFVLSDDLVMSEPFPRAISTLCSDDETRAAEVFMAASFADPDNPGDIDPRNLEMFAWDVDRKEYIFYAALPVEGSDTEVRFEVDPPRCRQCHLNGEHLDSFGQPMMPIMNELVSPWPHWNSSPDFPSHTFELPEDIDQQPEFARLTGEGRLGAAVQLEQIIRAGQTARVIPERLKLRRNSPPDVGEAMSLLRPLFCDEQVNYVTEDFDAGLLPSASIIAGGTREMYLAIRSTDWPWGWLNDNKIRFAEPSERPIAMLPVRGNIDVEYVRRLVAVRAITPEQVLRVQALDWKRPVFSEFRCGLWKDARARLRDDPPAIDPGMRNSNLLPALYDEIMRLDGEQSLALGADNGADTELVVMADAADIDGVRAGLAAGDLGDAACQANGDGFCQRTVTGFGDLLQAHADQISAAGGRAMLGDEQTRRTCFVVDNFPNRPALASHLCHLSDKSASTLENLGMNDLPLEPRFGEPNREVRLIPDGRFEGLTSEITVERHGGTVFAGLVRVRLHIEHSWRGDLEIFLTGPDGIEVPLVLFSPGDSADDVIGEFTAEGLRPDLFADGTWQLRVIDHNAGEQGHLFGWSIGVNTAAPQLEAEGARLAPTR
jgi:subtilisin-like proprotein convertase family protein